MWVMLDIFCFTEASETESVEIDCTLVARGFEACENRLKLAIDKGCGSEPAETKRAMLEKQGNHSNHQQQRGELELGLAIDY